MSVHCFLLALHSIILSNGASLETADFPSPARLDQQTAPYILSEAFWHTLTRSSCDYIIILIIVHAVSINDLTEHWIFCSSKSLNICCLSLTTVCLNHVSLVQSFICADVLKPRKSTKPSDKTGACSEKQAEALKVCLKLSESSCRLHNRKWSGSCKMSA